MPLSYFSSAARASSDRGRKREGGDPDILIPLGDSGGSGRPCSPAALTSRRRRPDRTRAASRSKKGQEVKLGFWFLKGENQKPSLTPGNPRTSADRGQRAGDVGRR